jgi:hypothetical protein
MTEPIRLPSVTEITGNLRAGFNQVWGVDRAYEFGRSKSAKYKGVEILRVVDGAGIRRFYAPAIEPNLVEDFAQVDSREKLKAFVERFGLLGFQHIASRKPGPGGDPVDWARARAREVHVALEVQSLLEEMQETGQDTKLRRELLKLLRKAGYNTMFRLYPSMDADLAQQWLRKQCQVPAGYQLPKPWEDDPARAAWLCLGDIINPLLRRIRFEIMPGDKVSLPNLTLQFDALIDVIAFRLATQLRALKPYICERCGRLGFSRRTSKKTCSQKCRKEKCLSKPLISRQSRKRSSRKRRNDAK